MSQPTPPSSTAPAPRTTRDLARPAPAPWVLVPGTEPAEAILDGESPLESTRRHAGR